MKQTVKSKNGKPIDWNTYRQITTVKGRRNFSAFHFGEERLESFHAGERKGFLAGVHAVRRRKDGIK